MADHPKPSEKRKREEEQELPEYMELFLSRAIDRFQAHFDALLLPRLNQFDNRLQALENPTPVPPTPSDEKMEAERKKAEEPEKKRAKKAQIQEKKKKQIPPAPTPSSTFASLEEYEEAVINAIEESKQMETPQQKEERELQEAIKRSLEK